MTSGPTTSPSRMAPRESREAARPSVSARHEADCSELQAAPPQSSGGGRVSRLERWLVRRLLKSLGDPSLVVELWNGEPVCTSASETADETEQHATVVRLRHRRVLWRLLRNPFFHFGECYSDGSLEIEGVALIEFLRVLDQAITSVKGADKPPRQRWFGRRNRNTLAGSQHNIHHHYDIGNEFYQLWLDEQLLYTCAYFEQPGFSLEQAQVAKMDHVCRKVWLQPGDTVIEAGCGWGAFALHMARHYGVTVRAYNISREQVSYARQRAKAEGLDDRVEFIQDDWRNIDGECDVFVSIGMLEHVGPENYAELGRVVTRSLRPHGRGLIHSIGQNQPRPFDPWVERRIFPGAYPPTLAEMMRIVETNALSVLDVENIRLHYAETLAHWLDRFETNRDTIAEMFDDAFVRMWRLYLAGSQAAFEGGRLQLYQMLIAPEKRNIIPRNRRYQYDGTHIPLPFEPRIDIGTSAGDNADKSCEKDGEQ